MAGELHFANINADNIIAWNERTNGNLKVAAGTSNAAPYFLMGAKNIKAVADLKGQNWGCRFAGRGDIDSGLVPQKQGTHFRGTIP